MRDINRIAHASMVQGYLSRSVQVEAEYVKIVIERKRFQEDSHELKE